MNKYERQRLVSDYLVEHGEKYTLELRTGFPCCEFQVGIYFRSKIYGGRNEAEIIDSMKSDLLGTVKLVIPKNKLKGSLVEVKMTDATNCQFTVWSKVF